MPSVTKTEVPLSKSDESKSDSTEKKKKKRRKISELAKLSASPKHASKNRRSQSLFPDPSTKEDINFLPKLENKTQGVPNRKKSKSLENVKEEIKLPSIESTNKNTVRIKTAPNRRRSSEPSLPFISAKRIKSATYAEIKQVDYGLRSDFLDCIKDKTENSKRENPSFKKTAKQVQNAGTFTKALDEDLTLKYIEEAENEVDYNEKYTRIPTPLLETDEEPDDQILKEMITYEMSSQGSASAASDIETPGIFDADSIESLYSGESGAVRAPSVDLDEAFDDDGGAETNSSQSTLDPDEVPDDIRELMEMNIFNTEEQPEKDVNDELKELGIWNTEDIAEEAEDEYEEDEDEDNGSVFSFRTMSETSETTLNKTIETQKPKTPEVLPQSIPLPIGDTPDILHSPTPSEETPSPSEESEPSMIYSRSASEFDEYESDVFGQKIQENIFKKPPSSPKSDAGESDMFYCVPIHALVVKSLSEYKDHLEFIENKKPNRKGKTKFSEKKEKRKKLKKRTYLNELFVNANVRKHSTKETNIKQLGYVTKSFRLRLAKQGIDPEEEEKREKEMLEKRFRRRVNKTKRRKAKLTKDNLAKIPNMNRNMTVMRWITLQKKEDNTSLSLIVENGWTGAEGNLASSIRLRENTTDNENKTRPPLKKGHSFKLKDIEYDGEEEGSITEGTTKTKSCRQIKAKEPRSDEKTQESSRNSFDCKSDTERPSTPDVNNKKSADPLIDEYYHEEVLEGAPWDHDINVLRFNDNVKDKATSVIPIERRFVSQARKDARKRREQRQTTPRSEASFIIQKDWQIELKRYV